MRGAERKRERGGSGRGGQRRIDGESFFFKRVSVVDNFIQLHQLQELVDHLLRSSTKKVERLLRSKHKIIYCEGEFHRWFHLCFGDVALLKTAK